MIRKDADMVRALAKLIPQCAMYLVPGTTRDALRNTSMCISRLK